MSSSNSPKDKFEVLSKEKKDDNFNLLYENEPDYEDNIEKYPFPSNKNYDLKKEIFEFYSQEIYWSTEDYFRIVYFKLNEIKEFKDNKIPAEFKNIPIEFSQTNRKMNLDLKFGFEEEVLNLNVKITNFLKENKTSKYNNFTYCSKASEIISETPNELNDVKISRNSEIDLKYDNDLVRDGIYENYENNDQSKKFLLKNALINKKENSVLESNDNCLNDKLDDINSIGSIYDNDINYFNSKTSLYNTHTIIGNNILQGKAKKPLFAINKEISKNKENLMNNIPIIDRNEDFKSFQTLELNSDLIDHETKYKHYDNRNNHMNSSYLKKNKIEDCDDGDKMHLEINIDENENGLSKRNNNLKDIYYNYNIDNDLLKKDNFFRQENENYPIITDDLDMNGNCLYSKNYLVNKFNENSNIVTDLKNGSRENIIKKRKETIDLTQDKEEQKSKKTNIIGKRKELNNIEIDCENNLNKILKEDLNEKKPTKILSKNMMDQEIVDLSSKEEHDSFNKDINLIEKVNNSKSNSSNNENSKLDKKTKKEINYNNHINSSNDFKNATLEKYEINPLAQNEENPKEKQNEKYFRVILDRYDFLELIAEEEIKFDLKMNSWNHQKQNFEWLSAKKLNLIKHTSETFSIAKYEDMIFDCKDFYLIKLIFSSKQKVKQANKEFCGIQNEKNTCYLNSIFQIFFNLKLLRKHIFSIPSNEGTPIFLMQQALYEMQKKVKNDIRIINFIRAMEWDESVQNDFTEIFFIVFEMLSDSERNMKGFSLLAENCTGVLRTYIKCNEINYESNKKEPFLLLQLDITGCSNLIECFEKFLSVEKMTEENKYELEDRSKHDAIKSLHFEMLPSVLFVSLMRFEYQEQIKKKFDKIEYDEFIDLGNYILKDENKFEKNNENDNYNYELFGVLVHDGNAEGGHYYVYIKENKSRNWVKFNDSKSMYVNQSDVFEKNFGGREKHISVYGNGFVSTEYLGNHRTAYFLIYLQRDKIDEILSDVTEADVKYYNKLLKNLFSFFLI